MLASFPPEIRELKDSAIEDSDVNDKLVDVGIGWWVTDLSLRVWLLLVVHVEVERVEMMLHIKNGWGWEVYNI